MTDPPTDEAGTPGAAGRDLTIREAVQRYRALIAPVRGRARRLVAAVTCSSLFEGLAIAALVPMLERAPTLDLGPLHLEGAGLRWAALGAMVLLGLAAAGTKLVAETWALRFLGDTEERLRREMTEHLLDMRWADFVALRIGDINNAALVAAAQISIGAHFFLRAVAALAAAAVLGALSFVAAPVLSLVTAAFSALAVAGYLVASRRAQRHAADLAAQADDLGQTVQEIFTNLKFFQSTGNVEATRAEADATYARFNRLWYRGQRIGPMMRSGYEGVAVVAIGAVLAVALATGDSVGPRVVAFLAMFARVVPRITLAQEWSQIARIHAPWHLGWTERVDRARRSRREGADGDEPRFERTIELRSVRLTYPGGAAPAVQDATWSVRAGEIVALVGTSGSGKTTCLDLLTGLLEPDAGEVLVDGRPLRSLDRDAWQRRIGLVLQQNPMLHASVAANVAWTEPEVDDDRIRSCLVEAGVGDVVDALPDGIHSVVGHAGARLSGGQLQRVALARALYRDPWLLVLDEPTSALDAVSERAVLDLLDARRGQLTTVLATHRLDLARRADRVVVMADGRVVEQGTFDELDRPGTELARLARSDPRPLA